MYKTKLAELVRLCCGIEVIIFFIYCWCKQLSRTISDLSPENYAEYLTLIFTLRRKTKWIEIAWKLQIARNWITWIKSDSSSPTCIFDGAHWFTFSEIRQIPRKWLIFSKCTEFAKTARAFQNSHVIVLSAHLGSGRAHTLAVSSQAFSSHKWTQCQFSYRSRKRSGP